MQHDRPDLRERCNHEGDRPAHRAIAPYERGSRHRRARRRRDRSRCRRRTASAPRATDTTRPPRLPQTRNSSTTMRAWHAAWSASIRRRKPSKLLGPTARNTPTAAGGYSTSKSRYGVPSAFAIDAVTGHVRGRGERARRVARLLTRDHKRASELEEDDSSCQRHRNSGWPKLHTEPHRRLRVLP